MLDLSDDQKQCFDSIMDWWKLRNPLLTFGGYAGTGKTTLISMLRNSLPETVRIAFAAYTGKASSVLRGKLNRFGIQKFPMDYCGTIHGLIYEPMRSEDDDLDINFMEWVLKRELNYDLIIVDEASMLGEDIFNDLKSFNIPILAVGDHGQLPPIEGQLNLMALPEIRLEKVHRFAEKNPLTKVSILAREQGFIPHGKYGDVVMKVPKKHSLITDFINASGNFETTAILCGFNATRISVNEKIRNWLKRTGKVPLVGERVICLKNNKKASKCPIYNGILGTLKSCTTAFNHHRVHIGIDGEELEYAGMISKNVFNNKSPDMNEWIPAEPEPEDVDTVKRFIQKGSNKKWEKKKYLDCFDFGYCLTVHKSQGSEWDRVMVIEEPCQYWSGTNWNRWLYTAVTRSRNELLIVR